MAKNGNRVENSKHAPTAVAQVSPNPYAVAHPETALPWILAFAFLALLWCLLVWFPLSRISAAYSVDYNEGLSCYRERAVVTGQKPYGVPPAFLYIDYPPLSFHLLGNLGRLTGELNVTGRCVSVIAYLLIGAFAAIIVQRLSRSWRYGVFAGLCWLIWLAGFAPGRIGDNDPHILGMAFSIAGLYCFIKDPEDRRWVMGSGIVFSLSLFIKHSLIAFPAAVGIYLLLKSRKLLWGWIAAAGSAGLLLLAFSLVVDGPYFLQHLAFPRELSVARAWEGLSSYLYLVQIPFIALLVWVMTSKVNGSTTVLIWAAAIAHLTGVGFRLGVGAELNHQFDSLLSLALLMGLALPELSKFAQGVRFPAVFLTFLLIVPFFLTAILLIPRRMPWDIAQSKSQAQRNAAFTADVEFIRSHPGPAICEDLLICYAADKPYLFDTFNVDELIKTGHMEESRVLAVLDSHRFTAIQLSYHPNEQVMPSARARFSAAFMRELLATYRPAIRTADSVMFLPR
jgi:hypothetical protein